MNKAYSFADIGAKRTAAVRTGTDRDKFSPKFTYDYNMSNAAMYKVANVLGVYTYELGLKNMKYAESTAVSLFLTVINFALVMITNAVSKRVNDYGIW